jgi:hypothetical protein
MEPPAFCFRRQTITSSDIYIRAENVDFFAVLAYMPILKPVNRYYETSTKGEIIVAAAKPMTLQDRILQIDHIQARRFSKLTGDAVEIATEGIIRHLRACVRMEVNPDASAVREIIDDAINGRRVFAETSNDLLAA